jgi:type I restriction enzyme S subunit
MKRYDSYKDSGVEWIGDIPSHWDVNKLFRLFKINTGFTPSTTNSEFYDNGSYDWINISDLESKYVSTSKTKLTEVAVQGKEIVPKGSLLYSFKLSVGKMAFADKDLYTNEAIFSIYPDDNINLNYYYYLLDRILIHNSNENIYGAKILNQELIKASKLIVPSKIEQTAIANYLDQKTTQIDDLIAKKERLIQLLEEERTAIINQAVTKGLDPNVPMKDSGMEWLGEIPAHWEVKKLKYVIQIQSGKGITQENLNQDGEFAVWGGNGIMGYTKDFSSDGDDLIIGRVGALCGNVHLVHGKKWISDNALYVRTNQNQNFVEFFLKFLDLNRLANKNAQPLITGTMVKDQFICLPSKKEQEKIVNYINNQHECIGSILSKSKQQIELLKEFKTALISEVVTGKVDVRNWQPMNKN